METISFSDCPGAIGQSGAGLDLLDAFFHRLDRVGCLLLDALDHVGNLAGRLAGPFGQLADLVGYHREAATLLAGAGGFDRRVERQEVGLVGDVVDHVDDLADSVGRRGEGADRLR